MSMRAFPGARTLVANVASSAPFSRAGTATAGGRLTLEIRQLAAMATPSASHGAVGSLEAAYPGRLRA